MENLWLCLPCPEDMTHDNSRAPAPSCPKFSRVFLGLTYELTSLAKAIGRQKSEKIFFPTFPLWWDYLVLGKGQIRESENVFVTSTWFWVYAKKVEKTTNDKNSTSAVFCSILRLTLVAAYNSHKHWRMKEVMLLLQRYRALFFHSSRMRLRFHTQFRC